jgi:serine/threonine-protein kinase RIO1
MTFIGSEGKSAPILKEAVLSSSQLNKAYSDSVVIMKDLYTKCGLIHADLSEFNLMWYENQVWVIDVSQAVMTNHPHALGFLLRDCVNVTNVSADLLV